MSDNFIIYFVMNFLSSHAFGLYFVLGWGGLAASLTGVLSIEKENFKLTKILNVLLIFLVIISLFFLGCIFFLPNQKTALLILEGSNPAIAHKIQNALDNDSRKWG